MTALEQAYGDLVAVLEGLDEPDGWQPTGCAGWCVRDLVFHLLADAQRGLVALHTPAPGPADTDAVSYWRGFPGGTDAGLRATRACATAVSSLAGLVAAYAETSRALLHAVRQADPEAVVSTQGHALRVADLVDTLVVEAAVHHLDLVVALDRPGPGPDPLAQVRRTAEALLGESFGAEHDDGQVARLATGRAPAPPALAARLPVLS